MGIGADAVVLYVILVKLSVNDSISRSFAEVVLLRPSIRDESVES